MCCRTSVQPLDIPTAVAILSVGLFRPTYWPPSNPQYAVTWERAIPEEGAVVSASIANDALELSILPAISVFAHHAGKRLAAGVYFEIAARYAEKVGGVIVQKATVQGCTDGPPAQELVLARYPEMPLSFDRVCPGFRAVILGEPEAAA